MKRTMLFAVLGLGLISTACGPKGVLPPGEYQLSGQISGNWSAQPGLTQPRLRLALTGLGLPKVYLNKSDMPQNVLEPVNGQWAYGTALDQGLNLTGIYQIIAFNDANNDSKYQLGEEMARNNLYLIHSLTTGQFKGLTIESSDQLPWKISLNIPDMQVQKGWNVYDMGQPVSSSNPTPATQVKHYDLKR